MLATEMRIAEGRRRHRRPDTLHVVTIARRYKFVFLRGIFYESAEAHQRRAVK